MTTLYIFPPESREKPLQKLSDHAAIAKLLREKNIRLEQWPTKSLPDTASNDDYLAAYHDEIETLKTTCGFTTADIVSLTPDNEKAAEFRQKFLSEHIHSEDEIRFFIEGSGIFYLNLDNTVYALLCEQHDLISVPDGTPHWFDMGPAPHFRCIRLFTNPEGWVADFTGNPVSDLVPRWEALLGNL